MARENYKPIRMMTGAPAAATTFRSDFNTIFQVGSSFLECLAHFGPDDQFRRHQPLNLYYLLRGFLIQERDTLMRMNGGLSRRKGLRQEEQRATLPED